MKLERIQIKTLRERVYDQLRSRIISGDIFPGQSVTLRALAKEFGVSVVPVREALFQLESENIIVIENNRSIRVNVLTAKEIEEAYRIRLMLEPWAAERSCELRPDNAVTRARRILEEMKASIGNPKKYMLKNSQFHFEIYCYADSPLLLQIIDGIWARIGPYLTLHTNKEDLYQVQQPHEDMFQAFADKDKRAIKEAVVRDLEEGASFIVPHLKAHPPAVPD
jgi:DNA-binding GntR family transcriptional regulator